MSTTTHSKITKGKAPTPYNKPTITQRCSGWFSSPRMSVNHLIRVINLPGERFDTVFEPLRPVMMGVEDQMLTNNGSLNDLCNIEPPSQHILPPKQGSPPDSPTGIDCQPMNESITAGGSGSRLAAAGGGGGGGGGNAEDSIDCWWPQIAHDCTSQPHERLVRWGFNGGCVLSNKSRWMWSGRGGGGTTVRSPEFVLSDRSRWI